MVYGKSYQRVERAYPETVVPVIDELSKSIFDVLAAEAGIRLELTAGGRQYSVHPPPKRGLFDSTGIMTIVFEAKISLGEQHFSPFDIGPHESSEGFCRVVW